MSSRDGAGLLYRLYERRLRRRLAEETLPRHVAMIIDGNRRWARQRGLASTDHDDARTVVLHPVPAVAISRKRATSCGMSSIRKAA